MNASTFARLVNSCLPPWERRGLGFQLRSSADSIVSNIAESSGKRSIPEQLRFLDIALGSARELEAQLLIAKPVLKVPLPEYDDAFEEVRAIQQMLSGLAAHKRAKLEPLKPPKKRRTETGE
jgi:four helix bundle protein